MAIRNTKNNFGSAAKWFHWTTAFLLLVAYFLVYYRHWFTVEKTPVNWTVLQLHLSVGITILALAIARIIWRLINVVPSPEPGSRTQHLVIKVGHYSLYVMMLMMPVTGYLGTGANIDFYGLFQIDKFENTQIFTEVITQKMNLTFSEFEKPVDFIHKQVMGTWLVWMLIMGHVLAALYHTYIKNDRTLSRMTTNK